MDAGIRSAAHKYWNIVVYDGYMGIKIFLESEWILMNQPCPLVRKR